MARLLKIEDAAKMIGVPPGSLRRAAEKHGLLVRMGRTLRIDPRTFEELFEKCRNKPRDHESTGAPTASTTSATTTDTGVQRAQETADTLKTLSRNTSLRKTGQPAPVRRIK